MIENLHETKTRDEFEEAVLTAVKKAEWGWGSNWPDSAHNSAMYQVMMVIEEHLGSTD